MNTLKKIIVLLGFTVSTTFAQQITQFTQYTKNKFIINPAASGLNNKINATMGYRNQWTNLKNSPSAYYIGANYNLDQSLERSYINLSLIHI